VLKLMQKAADFKSRCKADLFIDAWRGTGFRIVGHLVYASDTHHPLGFCGTSNPQPGFAAHPGKSRQIKDQRSF